MRKIISCLLLILISINFLYVLMGVALYPLRNEDAIGIWMLKAKGFYIEGGVPLNLLKDPTYLYSHPQYPLGLPWLISLLYMFLGGVRDQFVLFLYPLTYVVILAVTFITLRRKGGSRNQALLLSYILASLSPLVAAGGRILAGGADIFLCLAVWLILYLRESRAERGVWLVTLIVMTASQIKSEGVFLVAFIIFWPSPWPRKLTAAILALVPFEVWNLLRVGWKLPSDLALVIYPFSVLVGRLLTVVTASATEFLNLRNWFIFWPITTLSVALPARLSQTLKQTILPAAALIGAAFTFNYLFSNLNPSGYVSSSFDRILLQYSGIAILFLFDKLGWGRKSAN